MDLTTLTPTFLADQIVDEYISAIWTERYTKSGDCQIVTSATLENVEKLREGIYLALRGSKEVMQIETQSIENKLLTVVGKTLDEVVLDQRFLWAANPEYPATTSEVSAKVADLTDATRTPGQFIGYLVDRFAIDPVLFDSAHLSASLDWDMEYVPGLTLGPIDSSGEIQRLTAPTGPLYAALAQLAEQHQVGISLYLESADPVAGYQLKFKTYKGLNRTGDQSTNEVIRLTPELDGISDLKEVRSIAEFKNVVYVYYQGTITKHLLNPDDPEPEGLERRVLVTDASGEPPGRKSADGSWVYGPVPGSYYKQQVVPDIVAFREQNARDALANHNYIRSIDGKTSPISDYRFGTHYFLGDVIELEGVTGEVAKARITEFIRSHDKNGEKSYPTISVVP